MDADYLWTGLPGNSFKRNRLDWLVSLAFPSSLLFFLPFLPTYLPIYFSLFSFFLSQLLIFLPGSGTFILWARGRGTHFRSALPLKVRRTWVTNNFFWAKLWFLHFTFCEKKSLFPFDVVKTLLFMRQDLFLTGNYHLMSLERN